MSTLEHQAFAKRVVHFYANQCNQNLAMTCHHFMDEGKDRRTITGIIKRYQQRGNVDYIKKSGRSKKVATTKVQQSIKKLIKKKPSISVRNGASKLGISKSSYSRIKLKLGIKAYKKQVAPKYIKNQRKRAKTGCRKIYRKILPSGEDKILVIDDETYVYSDPTQINGSEYYHCANKCEVDSSIKVKQKTKFPKKYLVWQAMDEYGNVSKSFITEGNMNKEIYLEECLKKRLLPFLSKHHDINNILFWPDLATCHYSNIVQDWLKSKNIAFVSKTENPPNVPQARPIEKYWANCKQKYKSNNKQPKSLKSFQLLWNKISKNVADEHAKNIMMNIRKKLRLIGYNGVNSTI